MLDLLVVKRFFHPNLNHRGRMARGVIGALCLIAGIIVAGDYYLVGVGSGGARACLPFLKPSPNGALSAPAASGRNFNYVNDLRGLR